MSESVVVETENRGATNKHHALGIFSTLKWQQLINPEDTTTKLLFHRNGTGATK